VSEKDHAYVKMLNMMRSQGSKDNPITLQLGIMQSANSVKIGDLVLDKEDIMIADYLLTGYKRELVTPYVKSVEVDVDTTVTISGESGSATSTATVNAPVEKYIVTKTGLKKGDIVAVMKLYDKDIYVILAKVVSV
jgi:hypothetical protein